MYSTSTTKFDPTMASNLREAASVSKTPEGLPYVSFDSRGGYCIVASLREKAEELGYSVTGIREVGNGYLPMLCVAKKVVCE